VTATLKQRRQHAAELRLLDSYRLGQQHYRDGISDIHRRDYFGLEREAYNLGRFDAAAERILQK
jgi:hypothetical protein